MMHEARDFLVAHYALTSRNDTEFWKAVRFDSKLSESLRHRLELYTWALPNNIPNVIFGDTSWMCLLLGMNYLPDKTWYTTPPITEEGVFSRFSEKLLRLGKLAKKHSVPHHVACGFGHGKEADLEKAPPSGLTESPR